MGCSGNEKVKGAAQKLKLYVVRRLGGGVLGGVRTLRYAYVRMDI